VLSITSGIAVSVIYLPQSLLTDISRSVGVSPSVAGLSATTIQAGYALGIFFLVPLSDRIQPRRQVTVQAVLLIAAILVSAALPSIGAIAIGFAIVGLVANIAQVILPAANRLSPPGQAGATTATLVGSWLVGIFGGRIIAGVLVQTLGWRWVLVLFAALLLAILPLARAALRDDESEPAARTSYRRLLSSTVTLVARSRTLRQSIAIQFFVFATFNSLWTVVVVHLTGPSVGWSLLAAGLFGFVGLAVGLFVPFIGRFVDRIGPLPFAGVALGVGLVASVTIVFDSSAVLLFGASMFFIALAQQATQSAVQSRLLATNPSAPGQANTVFMFCMFVGGAFGAFIGPWGYQHGGMRQVALQAVVFVAISLVAWGTIQFRERAMSRTSASTPS